MATHGSVEILDPSGQYPSSGGAFTLDQAAPTDLSVSGGEGWTIHVSQGSRDAIATGGRATSYEDAWSTALAYANKGLDLFSAKGIADLNIVDSSDAQEVWWITENGVALRFVFIRTTIHMSMPEFRITWEGQPPNRETIWHPSFRYFRRSQTTDDLFEAYRNLYLAVESLLDSIAQPNRGEREKDWLVRSLTTAAGKVHIDGYAPAGAGTPIERIVNDLYSTTRTAVFHAKNSRPIYLPGEARDRSQVEAALKRITNLYLALANGFQALGRQRGAMATMGFHKLAAGGLDTDEGRLILHATDSNEEFPEAQEVHGLGLTIVGLPTRREPTLDEPFVKSFFAEAPVANLMPLQSVHQIVATTRDYLPALSLKYDHPVTLNGLNKVEMHLGIRGHNVREPRQLYGA
jgi:hypothetical protein